MKDVASRLIIVFVHEAPARQAVIIEMSLLEKVLAWLKPMDRSDQSSSALSNCSETICLWICDQEEETSDKCRHFGDTMVNADCMTVYSISFTLLFSESMLKNGRLPSQQDLSNQCSVLRKMLPLSFLCGMLLTNGNLPAALQSINSSA
jgi:hypothetical protein